MQHGFGAMVFMAKYLVFSCCVGLSVGVKGGEREAKYDSSNIDACKKLDKVYAQINVDLVKLLKTNKLKLENGESVISEEPM